MSALKEYLDRSLERNYDAVRVLSQTAVNTLTVYRNKDSGGQLVLIRSENRNDDVFRALKCRDTQGLLPMIYEVATEEDALYVLEEYIEGETLFEKYKNASPDGDTLKALLLSLCEALRILHGMRIIHRDIKPNNILIRPNGSLCLVDLSIAKMMNEKAADTVSLGTVGYAAPEQFGLSQSSPATDIYAFGVIANQLVLGVHPTTQIPKGRLGKIIEKCTATQISKRYQSAEELKKALQHI